MALLDSKLILAKDIRLDKEHINVLDLSAADMLTVMRSTGHLVVERSDFSFIRRNGTIQAEITYSAALLANYIAFQNPDYSGKWFFAFVDSIEYKSEKSIEIYYTIDNWQTWFKDITLMPVFIEREHTNDDTKGNNMLPEPNGGSNFILNSSMVTPVYHRRFTEWRACVVSVTMNSSDKSQGYLLNDKMPCACNLQTFILATWDSVNQIWIPDMSALMDHLDSLAGDYSAVVNIFCYPAGLINIGGSADAVTRYAYTVALDGADWNITKPTGLNGYTPKNNKMLTFPFCWLEVSTGEKSVQYHYEYFNDTVCPFRCVGGATPIPEINLYPLKYKNYGNSEDPATKISINNFPQVALPIDSYKAWLAQSSSAQLNSILRGGAAAALGGGISGGPAGALFGAEGSMVNSIANYLNSEDYARDASDSYKGTNTASIDQALGLMGFDFKHYALDYEEARNMDHFLSMFGYSTRRVKVPNITGRTYWNYIKINGNIGHGPVPADALEDINRIANTGVTIWHSHANVGNYTVGDANLANPII